MSNDKNEFKIEEILKSSSEPNGRNHFIQIRVNAQGQEPISGSEAVYRYMKDIETLDRESVFAIHLDTRLKIIGRELVSLGNLTGSIVDPKAVIREAIIRNSAAIILVHNHPSGDFSPSTADKLVTEKVKKACDLVGIDFLDHIIIGANGYVSMADKRLL